MSQEQAASPRPEPSVESGLAQQSAADQSDVSPRPTVTSAVSPFSSNNDNSSDVNDWTDDGWDSDEWDDDDEEDEEMQVSNCCDFILLSASLYFSKRGAY